MTTMNPFKFVGGFVLEVGAVIAALAILPGLGGSNLLNFGHASNGNLPSDRLAAQAEVIPNQVYFSADSNRVMDQPQQRPTPPAAWQNDYAPTPPVAQQRFVENMLDHNSQRAMDAAARLWNQGDRLLPAELRVRRETPTNNQYAGEPVRQYQQPPQQPQSYQPQQTDRYQPQSQYQQQPSQYYQQQAQQPRSAYRNDREMIAEDVLPSSPEINRQPSHYAPSPRMQSRYSAQEQPRRLDGRF
ncbi:hypothetical protein [Anatilimnocola floriformis]|uniref:hypothetical protein n=1 Tax=Anatilimnocola floriformis TaxID=2948575 RepID=UPI0020C21E1F|nr:hypothetical protein [Anatilimnocola floriformis]